MMTSIIQRCAGFAIRYSKEAVRQMPSASAWQAVVFKLSIRNAVHLVSSACHSSLPAGAGTGNLRECYLRWLQGW